MVTTEEYLAGQLRDPNFAALYRETRFEHTFADALWHARKRRGLSRRELADHSGVSRATIKHLERAGETPTITTLWLLLQALNCYAHISADAGVQFFDK